MSLIENALCEEYNAQVMVGEKDKLISVAETEIMTSKVLFFFFFGGGGGESDKS